MLITGGPYMGYVQRLSPAAIAVIRKEVDKRKREGFIEASIRPCLALMFCIPNPDSKIRV